MLHAYRLRRICLHFVREKESKPNLFSEAYQFNKTQPICFLMAGYTLKKLHCTKNNVILRTRKEADILVAPS